jgi:hypothetical protein
VLTMEDDKIDDQVRTKGAVVTVARELLLLMLSDVDVQWMREARGGEDEAILIRSL